MKFPYIHNYHRYIGGALGNVFFFQFDDPVFESIKIVLEFGYLFGEEGVLGIE